MERKIFYCKQCGQTFSDNAGNQPECPNCRIGLIETEIYKPTWDNYTKEEKDEIRATLKEKYSVDKSASALKEQLLQGSPSNDLLSGMARDIKQIAHDIHFMYIVLAVYVVLTVLGILIIMGQLSRY